MQQVFGVDNVESQARDASQQWECERCTSHWTVYFKLFECIVMCCQSGFGGIGAVTAVHSRPESCAHLKQQPWRWMPASSACDSPYLC